MFNIRVVTIDYYISEPIEELNETKDKDIAGERQEPVLRIFGPTANGFTACVHIHGVYPYIYVPYKGGENPDRDALLVGAALDEALKTTLKTKIFRFVYKVTLVSGIPLYGYHSKHRQYFKIYFYNPYHIRKASELLLSGGILGQRFQPHEAHIPFALQFMMDYNIYGMSFATFSKVKYRRNSENSDSLAGVSEVDFLSSRVKKITCSHFEVDALACDIVNRIDQKTKGSNPGLRAIWEDEKVRRREQDRYSQITVEQSGPRVNAEMDPTEIMYKAQLAEKLKQISLQELEVAIISDDISDEPMHSYPAEVPENADFLEASAIEEGIGCPRVEEQIKDISILIDQRILTQIGKSQEEKAESEEEEMEADSLLGRDQKAEEEAELEDEEGVDMTQPLDLDEEVICGAEGDRDEPWDSSKYTEDTFWRSMADKIFQLDGAQESSSESDTEATPSGVFGSQLELSSAWSGNIMSILSEDSGCPTPSTVCQTPRTFWSNYSPNWLPQSQDLWALNKNCPSFSELASKNQSDSLNSNDFFRGSKENVAEEPFGDLFTSNDSEYFQVPAMTSLCNMESAVSPSSAILAPGSDPIGSDINLDSICESLSPTSAKEERFSSQNKVIGTKITFNKKPESDRQKFLHVLKSFVGKKEPTGVNGGQLTLKQYIKDCKEIVSVDFKNLCNKEMIIIEYKSENKRSFQNKYLIKPLDKFLESWDSAEKKAGDHVLPKDCDGRKIVSEFNVEEGKNLRSVINVLEKTFSDSSTVQSLSNKLTVKSMGILPDDSVGKDRCYNVNQNLISQGKIKMKLIKSQGENLEKNLVEEMIGDKCLRSDFNGKGKKEEKKRKKRECGNCIRKSRKAGRTEKRENFSEPDTKLINEINSSFEEYFKTIVQRKHFNRKKRSIIDVKEVEEEEEEEEEEEGKGEEENERCELSEDEKRNSTPSSKKRGSQDVCASTYAESIKFVNRFLSTFSRMSDMPPLSITISLGNPRNSVPIQVDLHPTTAPSGNKIKCFSKIQRRRRMKVENVDGPADGSSSEDSAGGDSKHRDCSRKNIKKGSYYKPLSVVVSGSPSKKKGTRKKRKKSFCEGCFKEEEEEKKEKTRTETGRESFSTTYSDDGFGICRENSKSWSPQGGNKEKISSPNVVKSRKNLQSSSSASFYFSKAEVLNSREVVPLGSAELDFIDDSDEERKCRPSRAWPKVNPELRLKKIPQADTEAFTSSDDDELNWHAVVEDKKVALMGRRPEGKEEISSFYHKSSFKSGHENKSIREEIKGSQPKSLLSVEKACERISQGEINFAGEDEFSQELKISRPGTSPGTQGNSNDSSKNVFTQKSLAFTLSGSPLFTSDIMPGEFESSTEMEAKPFSVDIHPKEKEKPCSQNRFFGFSKWNDQEAEVEAVFLDWVIGQKIIKPKKKALTRKGVELMWRDEMFESEKNAPFYSDPRDLAKAVEAGPRVLRVENRSLVGLKYFKSSLDIVGTEERRNILLTNPKLKRCSLVRDLDARIAPLIKPPPPKTVLKWSFTGNVSGKSQKKREKSKRIIMKSLSSGEEMGSDEEMELSVTFRGFSNESDSNILADQENVLENHTRAPKECILSETESGLKKGPLSKIKGIKKVCLVKKPMTTTEKAPLEICDIPCSTSVSFGKSKRNSENSFQIRGITLDNTFGFRHSAENMRNLKLNETHQYMSLLVMELHVQTRKDMRPDPYHDPIRALFYAIAFDNSIKTRETGILVVGDRLLSGAAVSEHLLIHYVPTEKELIEKLLDLMRVWDPEILAGYEIEMHSWGYLVQRGFILNMNLLLLLGRVQTEDLTSKNNWDFTNPSNEEDDIPRSVRRMQISGRIVLDVWRIFRHEVSLTSYTFENVMYHLLHERHSLLSYESLSRFWEHPSHRFRHAVVEHYTTRVLGVIRILDQLDFINRTSELSRLFGIQFYEVLSRGSQFRVESMMLRLAKPLNYVPTSPSVAQRAAMRAPASLPLILEPESLFYSDPVIVLDFQSLYPSIIIAYNYCFSTCLGRVEKLGGREPFEFGCTQLQIAPEELKRLEDDVSISPAGIAFVKSNVRKGVLPTMLEEILETRMMVKKSLKENKGNKTLEKVLYARQLGLKLIANVTYGYTAANFSGRMPCIEVGDSVVSKGRETLHRAIRLVKSTRKWGAKVVYGDTDSIFVCTPGKSRAEAFKIGAEIAEAVTRDNPKPVKLKLEKVYQPSILQTKKRYVGYMFESPEQDKPVFEAKGIETVRRDGCPATGKILEKALQILFDTSDVSLVKKYTIRQFTKLFQGRVNLQDLIFAKEYRGRKGYRAGACVPALQLAKQWTQYDKRAEPRIKERVPYVIVNGPPGVPLIRLVRSPTDLISDPSLRINAVYYITKALIPPLQRCFSLLGADVTSWFIEMPRKYHKIYKWNCCEGQKRNTISQYFSAKECVVCSEITNAPVCPKCEKCPQVLVVKLTEEIRCLERCHDGLLEICRACCRRPTELDCISLECPVLFRKNQAARALKQCPALREIINRYT